jgi:tetratricopeptide (TPR) repeat protein
MHAIPGPRVLLPLALLLAAGACADAEEEPDVGPALDLESAAFVGREACRSCHAQETAAWEGSHHDLALDVATDSTVLGDFGDTTFRQHGITHRFFRRGEEYWVETEGPSGEMEEYQVTHVIGVEPLQQYLVPFPGGKLQTLPLTWDARPAAGGGQRWYHIYGEERIAPDDPLFWAGVNQNWNYQCAECHSTELRKSYRSGTDSYDTTWEEIDVSCEACHGPGSLHVDRARAAEEAGSPYTVPTGGDLLVDLSPGREGSWTWSPEEGKPVRSTPVQNRQEIDTCARCHARRGLETLDYEYGRSFLSTHRPALPTAPLYYHDGQILDEVYVYGSFLQSRMYQAGVLCSDCHDPHSNDLLAPGPEVCARCHAPAVYGGPQHDFHPRPVSGIPPVTDDPATWRSEAVPSCLDCHMRERTYMGVDDRGDHSFRIPRPDLAPVTGAPDACSACHASQGPNWAADQVASWYGPDRISTRPHYGAAFALAARQGPGFAQELVAVAEDSTKPGIVRAAAVEGLMGAHPRHLLRVIGAAAQDADPFVRRAAMNASEALVPEDRLLVAGPGLSDSVRGVRTAAASSLSSVPPGQIPTDLVGALDDARVEWVQSQLTAAEHPSANVALGTFYARAGRGAEAEAAMARALSLDSTYVAAWVNLADLYRALGREGEAERLLTEGLRLVPGAGAGALHHSLGLLRIRQGRPEEGLAGLARAAELAPEATRYTYVLVVALNDLGRPAEARTTLADGLERAPWDRDLLFLGVSLAVDDGRQDEARAYASRLLERDPGDPDAQSLAVRLGVNPGSPGG